MIKRDKSYMKHEWFDNLKNIDILDYSILTKTENKIKEYVGIDNCVLTCNGTSAIKLTLVALNLSKEDEVIIPSYSYPAAYRCCRSLNLNFKICDINKKTLSLDPEKLKNIISNKTKVVIFINHLGYVGDDLLFIRDICNQKNIFLLEDSAHGLGQVYKNKMAGTIGDAGIYSFSGAKLIRSGSGGCFISNNTMLSNNVRKLIEDFGNYELSPICASLIKSQIENIDEILEVRKKIFDLYINNGLNIFKYETDKPTGVHAIAYLSKNAEKIKNQLSKKNIETRYKFYPSLLRESVSDEVFNEYIELPQSFDLTKKDIQSIIFNIKMIDKTKVN